MSHIYPSSASYSPEPQTKHAQRLMHFNQEIFKRNVLTDVECVVEGQVFQAHRALLVCFSPYLKEKLLNAAGKPTANKIYIPKIGSSEFEVLLNYMYSGKVEADCNNVFDIYKAASLLEMRDAKAECLQLIDGKDEIRTYFYSYVLSKKLGVEHNWQKALKLITHRFEETVFTKEFMQLDMKYVLEMLSAQSIGARSEVIVFLAALNWLNQDYGTRIVHAVPVMQCVRFSCMSMEEIVACFHPPFLPEVVQMPEVLMMLFRATCYIAAKSQGKETWFRQYANPKRNLILENLSMELWHKEPSHPDTPQMDSQWSNLKSGLPEPLKSNMQTIIDSREPENKLWEQLIKAEMKKSDTHSGKEDSFFPVSRQDILFRDQKLLDDTKDKKLDSLGQQREVGQRQRPLLSDSVTSGAKSIKEYDCILVVGGINPRDLRKDAGKSVHIFYVYLNEWLHYTTLPEPRHNHCTAYLEKTLYVVGGCRPQETIEKNRYIAKRSGFKLNLENTLWSKIPDMKYARYDHGMVVYKGCLIVIGGQDENGRLLKSTEMYDPKKQRWKLLNSNLCCGRKAMGITVYADRIWIAGGLIMSSKNGQLQVVSHVDYYHPDEKKWYFNSYLLPSPRCLCCLVDWNGKLYCLGGMVQVSNGKACPTDEVWFLDGENELWKQGPFLPEPRMGGIAVTHGEKLYYLGGQTPENTANVQNVIFLTPGAASWSIGPSMISDIFGLSAVSLYMREA